MRRLLASALAIILASPAIAPAAQDAPAPSLNLTPEPVVSCVVAGTNPLMQARLDPVERVRASRVYFKSALGGDYYYIELAAAAGVHSGALPKPLAGAGPISFYFEGLGTDLALVRSEDFQAIVVEKEADCGSRPLAALGSGEPVRVFSLTGGTAVPAGFSGVGTVAAGGSITAGVGATAAAGAAGGGGFLSGTTLIIAGAAAIGITTATILILNDEEKPPVPASPSR